jgi:hypothetical protein
MRWHLPAFLTLLATACAPPRPPGLVIAATTQTRVDDDLTIGAGNCWEHDDRPSCAIWITRASAPTYHYRVVAGQRVHAGARRIDVLDVTRGSVVVEVSR